MATSWGALNPPSSGMQPGDIWISLADHRQLRYDATDGWVAVETRQDVAPVAGTSGWHLAKAASRSFDTRWVNASDGLVTAPHTEVTASAQWNITHGLQSRWVDVTVYSPGAINPSAPQTIIIPDITFDSAVACVLRFAEPVAGTAIVRR